MPTRKNKTTRDNKDNANDADNSPVSVTLSVDDSHMARFNEVIKQCIEAGMRVEQRMKAIGVVSGKVKAEQLPALRSVEGVAFVESDRPISIAPPDSDIQ